MIERILTFLDDRLLPCVDNWLTLLAKAAIVAFVVRHW